MDPWCAAGTPWLRLSRGVEQRGWRNSPDGGGGRAAEVLEQQRRRTDGGKGHEARGVAASTPILVHVGRSRPEHPAPPAHVVPAPPPPPPALSAANEGINVEPRCREACRPTMSISGAPTVFQIMAASHR